MDKDFIPKTGKMITRETKKQIKRVKRILNPLQKPKAKKLGFHPARLFTLAKRKR